MPCALRQCSTTVSPALTWRTPGPVAITWPEPSWPSKCGRNLSSPFAPSISPSWEPQMPLYSMRTSTWPTSSCCGSSTSSMISGCLSSVKIAACMVFGMLTISLEVDEGVVTGVAGEAKPPVPLLGRAEAFAGHLPIEQVRLLLLVPIGLDADILVSPDPLDFTQGLVEIVIVQVV